MPMPCALSTMYLVQANKETDTPADQRTVFLVVSSVLMWCGRRQAKSRAAALDVLGSPAAAADGEEVGHVVAERGVV